ncbi:hypothetical protein K0U83_04480 [bacterium]|nr:hypothetical protein [bacterium]
MARAEWCSATYRLLAQIAELTPGFVAENVGVSKNLVYCWQSEQVDRRPTPDQAAAVAALLTDSLGRRVSSADLARPVNDIRVVFSR